jgi:hypothetical protein
MMEADDDFVEVVVKVTMAEKKVGILWVSIHHFVNKW